jgi:SpoVK/Ycf46/Vps4 family AAA+-type ATPase
MEGYFANMMSSFIHSFVRSYSQLLSKMDGVDALVVPTLVIGLTNKRSLIDTGKWVASAWNKKLLTLWIHVLNSIHSFIHSFSFAALLRPGRFEVQIEVPPPKTAAQRVSILRVHTLKMYNAGRLLVRDAPPGTAAANHVEQNCSLSLLTYDELLGLLAAECEEFTGASLAGVARAAASHALERAVMEFSTSPSEHSMMGDCLVTQQDFEDAVHDVYESNSNDWQEVEEAEKEETNETTDDEPEETL